MTERAGRRGSGRQDERLVQIPRVRLRWRVAAAFGLASLLLTGVLAIVTWNLASSYMLRQREQSATRQAEVNVRLVYGSLRSGADDLDELFTGLTSGTGLSVLLSGPQGWTTSGRPVDPGVLPSSLLAPARSGMPARERLVLQGTPAIAVALPVPDGPGIFVEIFSLSEIDMAFRFLRTVLVTGVAASAVFGCALGAWVSGRALRPLTELTTAAARVARGDLQARLPDRGDPDLVALATTFNATADKLEERVRRDARFAGDVSHELRSPLTTMANAAAVLRKRRGEVGGTAGRALDLLLSEVGRFERMVVDLLEISRDGQQPGDFVNDEIVDVGELVANVAAVRSGPAPPVEIDGPDALVQGDRRRLDRVVANLLDNAERHAGGAVRVGVQRSAGRVRIEVDDAGAGVDEEFRGQVFERFARGGHARRGGADGGGTGLGLALVAQHVRHHHGAVWVEDRPGGGARFVVELPEAQGGGPDGRMRPDERSASSG